MEQFLSQHGDAILSLIAGAVAGSLITLRVTKTSRAGANVIDQSKAAAGGDVVGGNKTVRTGK